MRTDELEDALAALILAPPHRSNVARQRARTHFLDTLGVMLAGARERGVRAVVSCACESARGAGAVRSVISAKPMSVRDAALCNGVAAHTHDFDDDEPHMIVGHPSVAVVSALLALAGQRPFTFGDALDAYVVGTETMLRVGALVNPQHYNAGWHCTASLGVMGAAAASAHALSLSQREAADALNIATTFSVGMRENFGTDGKPLQVGMAAANGVWACELSLAGLRGATSTISGRQGFIAMNGGRDSSQALRDFGAPWGIEAPGFNIKIYPCCSSTHTALDAMFELLASTSWQAGDIEAIDVWIGDDVPGILIHDVPRTGMQGKFSMRYCMAYAAVHRQIGIPAFTDASVQEAGVKAMMQRVQIHIDPDLPREATGVTHQSRVQLTSRNANRVQCSHALPIGSVERPCSDQQLKRKFLDCVSYGLHARAAQAILAAFDEMSDQDPLSHLLEVVHLGVAQ